MKKKKLSKKSEETLGILAHLQKNIPEAPKPKEEELEFPEDEDEDEGLDLLKPKPPQVIMGTN